MVGLANEWLGSHQLWDYLFVELARDQLQLVQGLIVKVAQHSHNQLGFFSQLVCHDLLFRWCVIALN